MLFFLPCSPALIIVLYFFKSNYKFSNTFFLRPSKFITESFSCEKASKLHKIDSEKFRSLMIATSESSILYDHPDSNFLASPVCICENKDEQQPTNPNLNCKCSFRPQYFRWNVEGRGTHGLSSKCASYEPRASIQYGESDLNFIFRQFIYIFGSVINPRHFNKSSTLENSAFFNKGNSNPQF